MQKLLFSQVALLFALIVGIMIHWYDTPTGISFPPHLAMTCSQDNYLAPVFQKLDSTVQWINHYPADKRKGNQLHYPVERDLSNAIHLLNNRSLRITIIMQLAQVVQMWDSAIYQINSYVSIGVTNCVIHWTEIYPVDSVIQLLYGLMIDFTW